MFSFNRGVSSKDKVLFYESIANLLDGGVTLLAAFKGFASRLPAGKLRDAVENTIFFVESGDQLNTAMRKLPDFYSEKEIAIIESGEQTGMLKDTFNAIAKELRNNEELKSKVVGALTYPMVIVLFLILALVIVMVYVIPQLMPVIIEMATEIPWTTKSLMATSDFFRNNFALIVGVFIAAALIFRGYVMTDSGKIWFDRFKIYNIVSGKAYKNYLIVQVMATFHLLSSSGVGIVKALRLTGTSSGNVYMASVYHRIADAVSSGRKISEAMQELDKDMYIFTPDIVQLIESAEKTSTVHQVTFKISEQYRRELDAALATMVKLIEPVALLGAGVFVMWFALAIFSVVMQITQSAGIN